MKKYLLSVILTAIISTIGLFGQPNRIHYNNQDLFLSGMNLAWINYGNDLTNFNQTEFERALNEVKAAKGNTIRWWLHVTGEYSPTFNADSVTGITPATINNLKKALDMAQEKGIGMILCLWSFGMLDNVNAAQLIKNRNLLTNSTYTKAYIRNALIPMVDSVKGHPAIVCWEIFNEPEGMASDVHSWAGWAANTIPSVNIQRFINLTTGAIHRSDPDALVSSGSWNVAAVTDRPLTGGLTGIGNLYRDDRLVNAGGDGDGTLDFYMIHFYEGQGTGTSPFHHPASYWGLNKPIVVGEFSAHGPFTGIDPETAYRSLYDSGYAGGLGWTWTGHDGNGNTQDARPGMEYLFNNHQADVEVIIDSSKVNFTPYVENPLQDIIIVIPTDSLIIKYANLDNIFKDVEDSPGLIYSIQSNSNPQLVNAIIIDSDSLCLGIKPNIPGAATITIKASDSTTKYTTALFSVSLFDSTTEDRARFRKTTASSIEDNTRLTYYAVDGSATTRWSSKYTDDEWFKIELENTRTIQRIMLNWEAAYGKVYKILLSEDGANWDTAFKENYGNGSRDLIVTEPTDAKYIMLDGLQRGTQWGYSLWSFEVYETPGENTPPYIKSQPPSITLKVDSVLTKTISGIFADSTLGDQLVYEATLQDGSSLPTWLSLNLALDQANAALTGTPVITDTGSFEIKITAIDRYGESVSASIDLTVFRETNSLSVNLTSDVKVFPNPANSQLNIVQDINTSPLTKIELVDIQGKKIITIVPSKSDELIQLNISGLESGIYYLYLQNQQGILTQKIIKSDL